MLRYEWRYFPHHTQPVKITPTAEATQQGIYLALALSLLLGLWLAVRWLVQPAWLNHLPPTWQEALDLSEVAGLFTLSFLWTVLWWRERPSASASPSAMDVPALHTLSPRQFEEFVAALFRRKGYLVQQRGGSGDAGVDLEIMQPGGKRAIAQCKRYRSAIGPDIVRELYGTLIHEQAAHAFLVTTADISDAAREWAKGKPMTLIDGQTVVQLTAVLPPEKL